MAQSDTPDPASSGVVGQPGAAPQSRSNPPVRHWEASSHQSP